MKRSSKAPGLRLYQEQPRHSVIDEEAASRVEGSGLDEENPRLHES